MGIRRKGFTLVELLIVIVVIGILSAAMMFSSTEAISSAKASNIVSGLRNWKTAALAYYIDNIDECDKSGFDVSTHSNDIAKYLNDEISPAGYNIQGSTVGTWYVTYDVSIAGDRVKEKLEARAQSLRLHNTATSADSDYYVNSDKVYLFVR